MSMPLLKVICLLLVAQNCCSHGRAEDTDEFVRKCHDAGFQATIKESTGNTCSLELSPGSNLELIPESGDIKLELILNERSVNADTIVSVSKGRRVLSLAFVKCSVASSAIDAMRRINLHSLSVTESNAIEENRQENDVPNPNVLYELTIENCDAQLAGRLLSRIGFATRTIISMPKDFPLTLGDMKKHVEKLVIHGCSLTVEKEFESNDNIVELIVTNTRLSAVDISRFLRLKGLCLLSLYKYDIEESEWSKFQLPAHCSKGLAIVTTGRLLDFLDAHLDSEVQISGRRPKKSK
jgi:hypothetical protein